MAGDAEKNIVLTCYYRPKPGGLCKRLFRAIEALLKRGHSVHYLALTPFPIGHPDCHFHRFPWPFKKSDTLAFWIVFNLFAPIQLTYIGFRHRIAYAFAFGTNYAALLQPLRLLKRIPLTVFVRADVIQNHLFKHRPNWIVRLDKFIEAIAISGVHLHCVSHALETAILSRHTLLHPHLTEVLPNDVPDVAAIERDWSQLRHPLRLACVGVLEARKNQAMLLQLMQQIDSTRAQLFLYGDGPDRNALEREARERRLSECVHILGWVEPSALIWQQTDILLFPSLHEGSPNAVLEAIAHRVPVLASNTPEHRELLPREQLLTLNNIDDWAKALTDIIQRPQTRLARMVGTQTSHTRHLRFDWNDRVCKLITHHSSTAKA